MVYQKKNCRCKKRGRPRRKLGRPKGSKNKKKTTKKKVQKGGYVGLRVAQAAARYGPKIAAALGPVFLLSTCFVIYIYKK